LHWKLDPDSGEENVNVGVGSLVVPEGPESIVVSGGVASTVNVRESGVGSTLPAGSMARTENVWEPSARCTVVFGELQGEKAPASTLHLKRAPDSGEENVNVGVGSLVVPEGPESIVVSGG
jgi:hypothetical protein